jgi:hypothetical protein
MPSGKGSLIVTGRLVIHPFASVTVTRYDPDDNPFSVAAVPPDGNHKYVNGPVPPAIETVAVPSLPPAQFTFVNDCREAVPPPVLFMFTEAVVLHPFASVTVTLYPPAPRLFSVVRFPPEDHE